MIRLRALRRRAFLMRASSLAALGWLGHAVAWAAKPRRAANQQEAPQAEHGFEPITVANVKAEHFAPLMGSIFQVAVTPRSTVNIMLVHADDIHHRVRGGVAAHARQPFALGFKGAPGQAFPQDTYPIFHPFTGWVKLFIVPVGKGPTPYYEAIFG